MALFIFFFLIMNNCLCSFLGSQETNNRVLEIKSTTFTADQSIGFYKVDETLNLTCIFKNESTVSDVVLEWVVPSKASNSVDCKNIFVMCNKNTQNLEDPFRATRELGTTKYLSPICGQNRATYKQGSNFVVLIIQNLQENDSGEYKCKAIHNGTPFFNSESSVRIKVKNKKKECTDVMFQCSPGICIHKRYTCDGFRDCRDGEDEASSYCGPGNPCDNKLKCPDYNRCIPITWCCESHREPNCTTKVKHSCCNQVDKLTRDVDSEIGFQFDHQRFSDMGFLQTTVYTVIGCAMAFMFIVTIIVIAICRVHVRRTLLSRCPTATRTLALGRGSNIHGNTFSGWSFYNTDDCFDGSSLGENDLMSLNPLLVTYNINNGVQFIGRPIEPPPYCEIVTSPPKEGPPPPYASQENLCLQHLEKTEDSESVAAAAEPEARASEAPMDDTTQNISTISCTGIDVVPLSEELLLPPEAGTEHDQKECADVECGNNSSQCVADTSKCDGGQKNGGVNIVVVSSGEPETTGPTKIQTGESSSYFSVSGGDKSKGAVKKLHSTKSLDGNFRRKGKAFPTNHNIPATR